MTKSLVTYYIPANPEVTKGTIYALYLNHNTNLDLSQITNVQTITLNQISENGSKVTKEQIIISKDDYTKLLELNNQVHQLTNKQVADINAFIQAETKTTEALSRINIERAELIKKLTMKGLIQ